MKFQQLIYKEYIENDLFKSDNLKLLNENSRAIVDTIYDFVKNRSISIYSLDVQRDILYKFLGIFDDYLKIHKIDNAYNYYKDLEKTADFKMLAEKYSL